MPLLTELWKYALSPQQRDIHELISRGLSQKQTAETLGISAKTVQVQVSRIKQKQRKLEDNKTDTKPVSQYPSALLDAQAVSTESEVQILIKELECSKGLNLDYLQKEIISLKSVGKGSKDIAASLGITTVEVQACIKQAVAEIKRAQYSENTEDILCEVVGGKKTVNEVLVLSCLSKGISVKGTAERLGRTVNSVRKIMSRSDTSARALKEQRKKGARFKYSHYSPPSDATLSLFWKYCSGTLSPKEKVEAEIVLRSEGLIRSVPTIMKNNGRLFNMFYAQKKKRVFQVTSDDEKILRQAIPGIKGSILEYSGASLLLVNRYAQEEEADGTSYTHTYAVDHRFWPSIQMLVGRGSSQCMDAGSCRNQKEKSVSLGSCVLLQLLGTDETIRICITGDRSSAAEKHHVLSPKSPLAEALYGLKEGEGVTLEVVKGVKVEYKILQVQNSNV